MFHVGTRNKALKRGFPVFAKLSRFPIVLLTKFTLHAGSKQPSPYELYASTGGYDAGTLESSRNLQLSDTSQPCLAKDIREGPSACQALNTYYISLGNVLPMTAPRWQFGDRDAAGLRAHSSEPGPPNRASHL